MNTALKPNTAIVVTRPALIDTGLDKEIIKYISWASEHAQIILLDENPDDQIDLPEFEWDVVIRNTGMRPKDYFIANALSVLNEASNLTVVLAIDACLPRRTVFTTAGVLMVLQPEDV